MTQTTQTTRTANSIRSEQKEAPLENRVLKDEELDAVSGGTFGNIIGNVIGSITKAPPVATE
jgi:hypothetical protein